ncbi:MAG: hypothetical protein GEV09_11230 [Pseudonocardiaceae bacterium]|nr:hypothetical protein [Pseudonocardiaceae bacterium]
MTAAPEIVLRRVRDVLGSNGLERLDPAGARLLLRELLFDSQGVPDWHCQAACRDVRRELFFPEHPGAAEQVREAKDVCARCPVRAECLTDVMAWERPGYRYGVVGGLSARERQQLARSRRREVQGGEAA